MLRELLKEQDDQQWETRFIAGVECQVVPLVGSFYRCEHYVCSTEEHGRVVEAIQSEGGTVFEVVPYNHSPIITAIKARYARYDVKGE